jgi:UDP-N-acetylglucosamine 2-epimerase
LAAVNSFKNYKANKYSGIYGNGKAAEKIVSILKNKC